MTNDEIQRRILKCISYFYFEGCYQHRVQGDDKRLSNFSKYFDERYKEKAEK